MEPEFTKEYREPEEICKELIEFGSSIDFTGPLETSWVGVEREDGRIAIFVFLRDGTVLTVLFDEKESVEDFIDEKQTKPYLYHQVFAENIQGELLWTQISSMRGRFMFRRETLL